MKQTRIDSLVEAIVGTLVGLAIAMPAQWAFFSYYHMELTLERNFKLVMFMTVISVIRSFMLRRFFERHYHRIKAWLTTLCR